MRSEATFSFGLTGASPARAFPFYVVCDVSQSMWDPSYTKDQLVTPLSAVEDALPDILCVLEDDPVCCDTAHFGLAAFGDSAVEVLPLTPLSNDPAIPALPRQHSTDYAEVFGYLNGQLRSDHQRLQASNFGYYTPVMFFITDGHPHVNGVEQPESVWMPARASLEAPGHPFRPRVVSLGIGRVSVPTVKKLRSVTSAGVACVADGDVVLSEVFGAITQSIITSISYSVSSEGESQFRTPKGMRRLD